MMKIMILLGQFEIVNKQLKQKKKLRIKSGVKIVISTFAYLFPPHWRWTKSFITENMLICQRQWIGRSIVRK